LEYHEVLTINQVDQSVFVVDAPGPAARQNVAQRLRLADSFKRFTQRFLD